MAPAGILQRDCAKDKCGGDFKCDGCERLVGWCCGGSDGDIGEYHCDDCFRDRLAVLEAVKSRVSLRRLAKITSPSDWQRPVMSVATQLRRDGFLKRKHNGQLVLTARGKAAL